MSKCDWTRMPRARESRTARNARRDVREKISATTARPGPRRRAVSRLTRAGARGVVQPRR
eukprot:1004333-Prymnesium_polylepis.1